MLPEFLEGANPGVYLDPTVPRLTVDFEIDTSHGDFGSPIHAKNQMLLACWRVDGEYTQPARATWGDEYAHSALLTDVEDVLASGGFLIAHNAKYELMWLRRMGLDLTTALVFDTRLAEYVLFGNMAAGDDVMRPRSCSLDACCKRRGWKQKDPAVDILMHDGINPVEMPRAWLQGRCKQDIETTHDLYASQVAHLQRTDRLKVLLTRCLLTPVLAEAEFSGMSLDKEEVQREYDEHIALYNQLNQEMDRVTGGINWRSSPQVADFIYGKLNFRELQNRDKTPKRTKPSKRHPEGSRLTDQKAVDQLVCTTKEQTEFIELRKKLGKVNAAITKNLKFFQGVCKELDGTFHAEFHQANTATHRLASTGVRTYFECFDEEKTAQFQNLPRVFKPLFCSDKEDYLICEADGSQLEFRTAAHLCRDVQARGDILGGHDVHRFTASVLNRVDLDDVTKEMRQGAKADTFKPLYGGKSGTKEQQEYYAAFRERYPGITDAQKAWVNEVVISKRLITEWGMRYYWPYASMSRSGYVNVTTSVSNYPVQAFATAEIIPIALTYFWHRVKAASLEDKIVLVNTVHDSVICEVHKDYLEQWKEIAIQAFTMDVYDYLQKVYNITFDWVPLGIGMGWGTHWSAKDNEEIEMNVYHDGTRETKA